MSCSPPSSQSFTCEVPPTRAVVRRAPCASYAPDATASSRRPSVRSPATPRSGSEPQVMPAPVPKRSTPSARSIQKVRMPTASSAVPRSASTQPMPPQYGPRGAVSRASMIRRALDLGAPVTEPGGKAAASSSGQPASVAQFAADGGDEVDQARVLLDDAQVGDGHGAGGADPAEVVADQVHDHHVLGVVLLQEVRLGASGALDRARLDDPARRGAGRARGTRWRSPRRGRAGESFRRTVPGCRARAGR